MALNSTDLNYLVLPLFPSQFKKQTGEEVLNMVVGGMQSGHASAMAETSLLWWQCVFVIWWHLASSISVKEIGYLS